MNAAQDFDVVILGAGPAGTTAALRLLQLGYHVAIFDKRSLPRPNIGESLTAGVFHIVDFLEATEILNHVPCLSGLPTRLLWQDRDSYLVRNDHATHAMVDRGDFDLALLRLAEARGARCEVPTTVRGIERDADGTIIAMDCGESTRRIRTRYLLDARGRSCSRDALQLAPRSLAVWADLPGGKLPAEVCVEAVPAAWLWGAPLPDGCYRVMACCDPTTPRRTAGSLRAWFHATLEQTRLFAPIAGSSMPSPKACAGTPYLASDWWQEGRMKLGDAAFTLDPLSSCGVEKAMRFSLQASIALHTIMSRPADAALAREFLETRLHETVSRHATWTRDAYARAWPAAEHAFWRERACTPESFSALSASTQIPPVPAEAVKANLPMDLSIQHLRDALEAPVQLSPDLEFVDLACAVGDLVQRCSAARHPRLPRPIAFLEGLALKPLLASITSAASLGQWIDIAAYNVPRHTTIRVAAWLVKRGLIVSLGARQGSAAHALEAHPSAYGNYG